MIKETICKGLNIKREENQEKKNKTSNEILEKQKKFF